MAEYLRRVDLVHPSNGEQRGHCWIQLLERDTLLELQTAVNDYFETIRQPAVIARPHLISSQYLFIPKEVGPVLPERHIMTLTFATVGEPAFVAPTVLPS